MFSAMHDGLEHGADAPDVLVQQIEAPSTLCRVQAIPDSGQNQVSTLERAGTPPV
jgi:hypothetical protein